MARDSKHIHKECHCYITQQRCVGGVLSPGEKFISFHHSCGLDGERVRISCWNCPFEFLLEEGGHDFRFSFQLHLWTTDSSLFFSFWVSSEEDVQRWALL